MPYNLSDFGEVEKSPTQNFGEISSGRIIHDLPDMLQERLSTPGGGKTGDASREDSSNVVSMFRCGLNPSDVYATFAASARGKDAMERKAGHFDDYIQRTIRNAMSFLGKTPEDFKAKLPSNGNGNGNSNHIIVNFSKQRKVPEAEGIHVTLTNEVETEKPHWIWENYIPAGKITILAGDPGMGKSTIAVDLASRISKGSSMPSGGRSVAGTCLIASAEDAAEDTITPRLIAAEANLRRIGIMRMVQIDGELHYLSLPRDLERLRNKVMEMGVRILTIDPLDAFLTKGTDTYKNQDIRRVLAPLEDMAEETGVAILIVAHLNKKEDSSTLYRVGGSIGFIGAARSVLAVSHSPKKDLNVLYSLKSNLARKPPALAYTTKQIKRTRSSPKEWQGEETIVSSRVRWRGEIDFDPAKGNSANSLDKAEDEAENFLRQVLVDGAANSDEVYAEGRRTGIGRSVINGVKLRMGIRSSKGRDGAWWWSLPS